MGALWRERRRSHNARLRGGPWPVWVILSLALCYTCEVEAQENDTFRAHTTITAEESRRLAVGDVFQCPLTGVVFNLQITSLPFGWTVFYNAPYSDPTSVANLKPGQGDCLLWGAAQGYPPQTLKLGAFGNRQVLETKLPAWDNSVYWYTLMGQSAGFSGAGDVIPTPGDEGFFDCAVRMSWLLNGEGGYRAGCERELNNDNFWRKLVYYGPRGTFCEDSVCPYSMILKTIGLPGYCRSSTCTTTECCELARSCSPAICPVGFLIKNVGLPEFCRAALCSESECCVKAPACQSSICPVGYFLKPTGTLPPFGQPPNGCASYSCTLEECCSPSPNCPTTACGPGLTLKTVDPTPYCSSFTCSAADCCTQAGVCHASICGDDAYGLRPDGPPFCQRPNCTKAECCILNAPVTRATSAWLEDRDLSGGSIGGLLTWIPPPPNPRNVTHFEVMMGDTPLMADLRSIANVSWGTNQLAFPAGTPTPTIFVVYTANEGGRADFPCVVDFTDVNIMPDFQPGVSQDFLQFDDHDLDAKEIGGVITWPDPYPPAPNMTATVCRAATSLKVVSGTARTPPVFMLGDQQLNLTVDADGVGVMALMPDTLRVGAARVFRTADAAVDKPLLERMINTITTVGTILLMATRGDATVFFVPEVRRALINFGVFHFSELLRGDSYALIAFRARGAVARESIAQAGSGANAQVALDCPVVGYEVWMVSGANKAHTQLGAFLGNVTNMSIPADTPLPGVVNITLFALSVLQRHAAPMLTVKDISAQVSGMAYKLDNIDSDDLAGEVTWSPAKVPGQEVIGYNVYFAPDKAGVERHKVDFVPFGTNSLTVPSTPRSNFTYLMIFCVSTLDEQTKGQVSDIASLIRDSAVVVAVTIIGTVAGVQAVRVASTVFDRMNMQSMERSGSKLDVEKEYQVGVVGDYTDGDVTVAVTAAGILDMTGWRASIAPLFKCVHHHDPVLSVSCKALAMKGKVRMPLGVENAWDGDGMLLRKISNKDIVIYRDNDPPLYLSRTIPCFRRIMEHGMCSRSAFRMYAPMITLIGMACLVIAAGEIVLGAILIAVVTASILAAAMLTRTHWVQDVFLFIAEMPPAQVRDRFWTGVGFLIGCLPCAPAFISQTLLGYLTGSVAIAGAFFSARKAYGMAALVESLGGISISGAALFLRYKGSKSGQSQTELQRYTATFMGAALVIIKSIDGFMEASDLMYRPEAKKRDPLVTRSEDFSQSTGVAACQSVALEAFADGTLEPRQLKRLTEGLLSASRKTVARAASVLQLMQSGFHDVSGERWPESAETITICVGRVIDLAAADWYLNAIQKARSRNARKAEEKNLEKVLMDMEDSLRALVKGPLGSKRLARYREMVEEAQKAHFTLAGELLRFETNVGFAPNETRRGLILTLGIYGSLISNTVSYVRSEVSSSHMTPADVRILLVKAEQLQKQVHRAALVTKELVRKCGDTRMEVPFADDEGGNEHGEDTDISDARNAVACMQDALRALLGILHGMPSPVPTDAELQAMRRCLDLFLQGAMVLAGLYDASYGKEPLVAGVDDSAMEAAEEDIRNRLVLLKKLKKSEEALIPAAVEALAMARIVAGVAAVLTDEITTLVERADLVVNSLHEARKHSLRAWKAVTDARENMLAMDPEDMVQFIRKVKDNTLDCSLGAPVQALVYLQESLLEPTWHAMTCFSDMLDSVSELLPPDTEGNNHPKKHGWLRRLWSFHRRIYPRRDLNEEEAPASPKGGGVGALPLRGAADAADEDDYEYDDDAEPAEQPKSLTNL